MVWQVHDEYESCECPTRFATRRFKIQTRSDTMQELHSRLRNLTPEQRAILNQRVQAMTDNDEAVNFILTLQDGNTTTKLPAYCLHPPLGAAAYYQNIGNHLDNDQPLFGIQSPAFTGIREPFDDTAEMAAFYRDAIRRRQPDGDHALVGHSSGAYTAYEMALQDQKNGNSLPLLVIIDAEAPCGDVPLITTQFQSDDFFDSPEALMVTAWCVSLGYRQPLTFTLEDLAKLDNNGRHRLVADYLKSAGFIPQHADSTMVETILKMTFAHNGADIKYFDRHTPGGSSEMFEGTTVIYRCTEDTHWPGYDEVSPPDTSPYSGWETFCSGPIDVVGVPGSNHVTLIAEPAVVSLAQSLQEKLDQYRISSSTP